MNHRPQSQADAGLPPKGDLFVRVLWFLVGWCAVSCLTLPFVGRVWLGELPVLAVIQLPKITVAGWLRKHVVMEAMMSLGFSQGSFSPDFIVARPYALALAYLIPLALIAVIGLRRFRVGGERRRFVTVVLLVAAALDYLFTLLFANGRFLTIY